MDTETPTSPSPVEAFSRLIDEDIPPLRTGVVHPVDALALQGALRARKRGLIDPVLIGPETRIRDAATKASLDLDGVKIIDAPHSHAAAELAVSMAFGGRLDALMKGALHTNELMAAIIGADHNLRTDRRMSHAFVMRTNAYPKWLIISDGALNIAPDLAAKKWIVQNAIDLAQAIGIETPLVAILSATEEVDPSIASTVDAAALCKMADRGQIAGGLLDGPLAFDLAVSLEAVATKGLSSPVAGHADVLIVPNLEAGNMLSKQLDYLAGAEAAGLVLGAKVPIILTSRADTVEERVASCILAQCYNAWRSRGQ